MDTGSTAWILTSTALVLFMTMPGLALFYGGLVKSENVLSVLMHCFGIACVASITWLGIGYSIAFTSGNPYFGDFSQIFLLNMARDSMSGDIPESVFFVSIPGKILKSRSTIALSFPVTLFSNANPV